jgi:hypothetical protein
MRLFRKDFGYDEPFWYFGPWEFLLADQGWVITKNQVMRFTGKWPTYATMHPIRTLWKRLNS